MNCSRCSSVIQITDERVTETLAASYENPICEKCDAQIQLAAEVARQAALSGKSQKEILAEWIKKY